MESGAKLFGHPILVPLGLLTTSVVFDIVYLLAGDGKWAEISFWMIAAGVIGGLAAVLSASSWLIRMGAPGEPGIVPIVLSFVGVAEGAHLSSPSSQTSGK